MLPKLGTSHVALQEHSSGRDQSPRGSDVQRGGTVDPKEVLRGHWPQQAGQLLP